MTTGTPVCYICADRTRQTKLTARGSVRVCQECARMWKIQLWVAPSLSRYTDDHLYPDLRPEGL